jgi:DNA-directed RNA polymerase specialized sigma24 family protein
LRGWLSWRGRGCGRRGRDAASDEEDAALSGFDSLCAGLAKGQFPQLARRRMRQKRGGGHVQPACDLDEPDSDDDLLAQAVGSEPTPEFAVMVAEEYRRLLERLRDDVLRKVTVLRIEGFTTDAIADQLGCARRTVARQLALIRRILAADVESV